MAFPYYLKGEIMNHVSQLVLDAGVFYFSFTSLGISGTQWSGRLKEKGRYIQSWTESALRSTHFSITPRDVLTEIAIFPTALFGQESVPLCTAHIEAERRGLVRPFCDAACYASDALEPIDLDALGISRIIFMSEIVFDDLGDQCLFQVIPDGLDAVRLKSLAQGPGLRLDPKTAFAFALKQPRVRTA
jgi:hypothetical protein